jgi:cell division septation protein DedD
MGMVNFIQDFVDGQKSFSPDDFPGAKKKLDSLGVNAINVRYDFAGHENLLKLADAFNYQDNLSQPSTQTSPSTHPASRHVLNHIGACWGRNQMDQNPISLPMMIQKEAAEVAEPSTKKPEAVSQPALTQPKTPPQSGFYIEVGSYSTTQGLVDVQKQLKGLQLNYQTEIVKFGTVPVTRLLVGPYPTKAAASQIKGHLSMLGMAGEVIKR